MKNQKAPKQKWQNIYTLVLVANVLYFLAFFMITKFFA